MTDKKGRGYESDSENSVECDCLAPDGRMSKMAVKTGLGTGT